MQVVLSILPFVTVGAVWVALNVYMRRGDMTVQGARYEPLRHVYRLADGREINAEALRRVSLAMTVSFQQFAENMRQVQAAIAKTGPQLQRLVDGINQHAKGNG